MCKWGSTEHCSTGYKRPKQQAVMEAVEGKWSSRRKVEQYTRMPVVMTHVVLFCAVCRAMRDDSELVHVPVSVDTFHSRVAAEAVWAGADMVNDISGGLQDSAMLATVASLGVPYCLMHMRGDLSTMTQHPHTTYACVWSEVGAELKARAQAAVEAGVLPWNIILDPGLGFSKTSEGNTELLGHLSAMRREQLRGVWGRMPLLVGPSRKRFVGRLTGKHEPADRDPGTAAACVAAVAQGADILRVHNVPMVEEALRVADAVFRGTWPIFDD
jgi:2-amino-4-hydroxy-6-hydroxymethyldihydropteridine diphosphokinase/dihydropteroate synthase